MMLLTKKEILKAVVLGCMPAVVGLVTYKILEQVI